LIELILKGKFIHFDFLKLVVTILCWLFVFDKILRNLPYVL
jgi:hypothetical protein